MNLRPARPEDREALAALFADFGDYYAELAPHDFKRPDLAQFSPPPDAPDTLHLVAEQDGAIVAAIYAVILPAEDEHGTDPGLARPRMRIEFLATSTARRRTGAGTALVEAAETWARERGVTLAETWTYARSPLSMPFWTERAGYEPRSVILRKPL